ncbi:MAG: acyl-CoA thioesterase [Patescibacteria group bacterium]
MAVCELKEQIEISVRFSEVDSMDVVWHGNYVKYLEDGREAFGKKHGIHYLDFMREGIAVPLVNIELEYKKPLKYNEKAIVEIKYVDCEAAKLIFEYTIYRSSNMDVVATARSVQAFLNTKMELLLSFPDFFIQWKKRWLIK